MGRNPPMLIPKDLTAIVLKFYLAKVENTTTLKLI